MFNKEALKVFPMPKLHSCLRLNVSAKDKVKELTQYTTQASFGLVEDLTAVCTFGTVVWNLRAWALFELCDDDEPQIVRLVRKGQV